MAIAAIRDQERDQRPHAFDVGTIDDGSAVAGAAGLNRFAANPWVNLAITALFLLYEPQGLVGIWRRVQNYFLLWPFQQRPRAG
jgi:hypothetical protein